MKYSMVHTDLDLPGLGSGHNAAANVETCEEIKMQALFPENLKVAAGECVSSALITA